MKRFFSLLALPVLFFSCAKEQQPVNLIDEKSDVITFSSEFTKVVTKEGANTWQAKDEIAVFSRSNDAALGVSIDTNITYITQESGASVTFSPVSKSVSTADKYIAYYPNFKNYPSKLNAVDSIGFKGVAASDTVVDYRFMPITVDSGHNATVNKETRTANMNARSYFYAVADAPAEPETSIGLTFTPILPILEFGFYGKGTIKSFTVAYADKSVDVIGDDKSNWLTAKGVFNPVTGVLTTTNYNANAYYKIPVTLSDTVHLSTSVPTRFPMTVGRFKVTKGLKLIFYDDHDNYFTKTIWTSKTMSGVNEDSKCVHLYQKVNVPYLIADSDSLKFDAAGGNESITLESTAGNWSIDSKPEWISLSPTTGAADSVTITAAANSGAARTGEIVLLSENGPRCYIAVSQAIDYYKVSASEIDWTSSKIQYVVSLEQEQDTLAIVTKELKEKGKTDLVVNLYKGKDFSSMQTASDVWYISSDGKTITTDEPSGSIGNASYVPMYLTSPSGENNPLVKIGVRIYTINGYKTTKCGDGTKLVQLTEGGNTSTKRTVYAGSDYYIYNGYGVGATLSSDGKTASLTEEFAPDGWDMINTTVWGNLKSFVDETTSAYSSFGNSGLFTRNNYKYNGQLAYYSTWSSIPDGAKLKMLNVQDGKAPGSSNQSLTAMFEVILYKKVQ